MMLGTTSRPLRQNYVVKNVNIKFAGQIFRAELMHHRGSQSWTVPMTTMESASFELPVLCTVFLSSSFIRWNGQFKRHQISGILSEVPRTRLKRN